MEPTSDAWEAAFTAEQPSLVRPYTLTAGRTATEIELLFAVRDARKRPIRELRPHLNGDLEVIIERAPAPPAWRREAALDALLGFDIDTLGLRAAPVPAALLDPADSHGTERNDGDAINEILVIFHTVVSLLKRLIL